MPAVTLSLGVATCAKFVAEYLGVVASASANTTRLRHAPLNSAVAWLNNAKNCKDRETMKDYLNDARRGFMDAISLEEDENKIAAIVGLSMCQYMLGDKTNAKNNLQKVNDVTLSIVTITRACAKYALLPELIRTPLIIHAKLKREENFEEYKTNAQKFNEKVLSLPNC